MRGGVGCAYWRVGDADGGDDVGSSVANDSGAAAVVADVASLRLQKKKKKET